ncbi:MAG: hypothetical protein U0871_25625 [Gemmataceae bacterium]
MTRRLWLAAAVAAAAGLTGCSEITPDSQRLVDVTGAVAAAGRPVKDVTLNFQPTGGTATPAVIKLGPDGRFSHKMAAGEYTWYLAAVESGPDRVKSGAALKAIPEKYQAGSLDRRVKVDTDGQQLDLKVQ